jgi:protein TonB
VILKLHHWAIAGFFSAGAHLAVIAGGPSLDTSHTERSAGRPDVVWGVASASLVEELLPAETQSGVSEPVEATEAISPEPEKAVQGPTKHAVVEANKAEKVASLQASENLEPVTPKKTVTAKKPQPKNASLPKSSASGGPVGRPAGQGGRQTLGAGQASMSTYSARVLAHLRRHKRYPQDATSRSGTVKLVFVVAANGKVVTAKIAARSGNPAFDREALATLRRAAPFPAFPKGVAKRSLTFSVPIRFTR